MLLLATAGNYPVISVLGAIDAPGADALAESFDWLDGEPVIIVSLEACTAIALWEFEALAPARRGREVQVVYVQPNAPAARAALRLAAAAQSLLVAADLESAVRLANSLEGVRLRPFRPLAISPN